MYKVSTLIGTKAKNHARTSTQLWGMGLSPEEVERVFIVEVWGSGIMDPGPDFTEHRALDNSGSIIATHQMDGY
jgi:hypothetical protein